MQPIILLDFASRLLTENKNICAGRPGTGMYARVKVPSVLVAGAFFLADMVLHSTRTMCKVHQVV